MTHWGARIDAVKPVTKHLPRVIEALSSILSTCSLSNDARAEAVGLGKNLMSFDAIVLLTIWFKVLQCIYCRNEILQSGLGCLLHFPFTCLCLLNGACSHDYLSIYREVLMNIVDDFSSPNNRVAVSKINIVAITPSSSPPLCRSKSYSL